MTSRDYVSVQKSPADASSGGTRHGVDSDEGMQGDGLGSEHGVGDDSHQNVGGCDDGSDDERILREAGGLLKCLEEIAGGPGAETLALPSAFDPVKVIS